MVRPGIGILLVLIPCYFFFLKEIRPIDRARKAVASNEELINELQQAAVSTAQLGLMLSLNHLCLPDGR